MNNKTYRIVDEFFSKLHVVAGQLTWTGGYILITKIDDIRVEAWPPDQESPDATIRVLGISDPDHYRATKTWEAARDSILKRAVDAIDSMDEEAECGVSARSTSISYMSV